MHYAIETNQIIKKFPQNKRFRDLLLYPLLKKQVSALENISLKIPTGEIFCLLGPNGAGKTTLIKILCTLMLPTEGKALVNGLDVVSHSSEVRKTIGYVISEERSFYWRLNARQNLKFFGILNNLSGSRLDQRINRVLKLVALEDKGGVMFKDFSLGMKQKLAIARALLTEPQILFMDEPTRSLDPATAHSLRCFIAEQMVAQQGKTVFLATHNLKEVEDIGHRIAIIHEGKIKALGTPEEIKPVFERLDRYLICLKPASKDFLDKLRRQMEGKISLRVLTETGRTGMELEISLVGKESPSSTMEISEVIACIVNIGGRIESCCKKQIPLYEIYSAYTEKLTTNNTIT